MPVLIFPVRHHSPAAALQVERLIRTRRPRAVLVEGPMDATPLIPLLLDHDSKPPVAIYCYRSGTARASFYPFSAYSPEYVALKAGQAVRARLYFCDLPAGAMLDAREQRTTAGEGGPPVSEAAAAGSEWADTGTGYAEFAAALAEASGLDSFEAFWEAAFEQEAGSGDAAAYIQALADFGGKACTLSGERSAFDRLREQYMAATARSLLEQGLAPGELLLVCGAAHAGPVAQAFADSLPLPDLDGASPAELALIPFSFPRLSEQSGYGAGNRAPRYYQEVWEMRGNYMAASRRSLVAVARRLRQQGMAASPAQLIDAYNLARVLGGLRGKVAPGLDEVSDAAVACFGQGRAEAVSAALQQVLVGDALGRVTARVGRTPLQSEFHATAQRLGLPVLDAPRQVLLHMTDRREAEQSVFLHRLALATIPYGSEVESGLGARGRAVSGDALEQMARVREKWELQWSPATDAELVQRNAWGSTLAEVCGRLLQERLERTARIDEGTQHLLQMALCDLSEPFAAGLERCEALAADSASFSHLARAAYNLDGLLTYGSARRLPEGRLAALATRLFTRAALCLPAAALAGDEGAREVEQTLTALYELVRRQSPAAADTAAFWAAVEQVAAAPGSHSGLRGLCLVLLELAGRLPEGELGARLRYWLSTATEAADNARLVAGLFALHRGTLVRNRALIAAVTCFLLEVEVERLIPLLPVLRRTLGNLSPAERAYLGETLAAVLGLDAGDATQALQLTTADMALLREADRAVADILAGWRDRYGIG